MRFSDFHYIRRSDRRVICFLLAVFMAVSIVLLLFHGHETMFTDGGRMDSTSVQRRWGNYDNDRYRQSGGYRYYAVERRAVSLFPFDPNTADSTELLALGLEPWQVRNIYKYRAKGGVFRRREDFGRIYGLTNKQYRELAPYIRIGADYQPYESPHRLTASYGGIVDTLSERHFPVKLRQGERIELNGADTTQLMKVPGIGRYYAREIAYRRKILGGYYSAEQLLEIEDLPKEVLPYFYVNAEKVRRLNVNQATLGELKRHPYINYYQAKDIVDYRRLYGPIHDIEELKLMKDFTKDDFERLRHYIDY